MKSKYTRYREFNQEALVFSRLAGSLSVVGALWLTQAAYTAYQSEKLATSSQPAPKDGRTGLPVKSVKKSGVDLGTLKNSSLFRVRAGLLASGKVYQKKYQDDARHVREALKVCEANLSACHERLRIYRDIVNQASKFADNPMVATAIVNGSINLMMKYDTDEAKRLKTVDDYRPAEKAITDGKGICFEEAILKAIALNMAGVKTGRTYIMIEGVRHAGTPDNYDHAILVVDIEGKSYALNNQDYTLPKSMTVAQVPEFFGQASLFETLPVHHNMMGDSQFADRETMLTPKLSIDLKDMDAVVEVSLTSMLVDDQAQKRFYMSVDVKDKSGLEALAERILATRGTKTEHPRPLLAKPLKTPDGTLHNSRG